MHRCRRRVVLLLIGASACILLDAALFATQILLPKAAQRGCQPDNEGSWSIGLFQGDSPLNLTPIGLLPSLPNGQEGIRPASNPILSCADITSPPSNFVADPFLWLEGNGALTLFFETKSSPTSQGDIGVARSIDGGTSWTYLGLALDEPWHLSYPFVFGWRGKPFLLPEGFGSGGLRLYEVDEAAGGFPLHWRLHSVLVDRPLIDTSLVEWGGRWWMFTSDVERRGASKNGELEVYHADSLLGPWQPHALNPVMNGAGAAGARMGGRLVQHNGSLYRFGQDCSKTYGHKLVAYRIDELTPTTFRQTRVPFTFQLPAHPQGARAWNSARHHHLDAQQLVDGSWIAVMDGDSVPSGPISTRFIRSALLLGLLWLLALMLQAWQHWSGMQKQQPDVGGSSGGGSSRTLHLPVWDALGVRGSSQRRGSRGLDDGGSYNRFGCAAMRGSTDASSKHEVAGRQRVLLLWKEAR